jgi:hypothetical protein
MASLPRRTLLASAAVAALFFALPAEAQTVTTYGLKVPSEVMGFRYSGGWQMPGPGNKPVLVVGYNGGSKGEAVVMIYDTGTATPPPDEQALAKAREAFIEQMDERSNAAMNPKVVGEGFIKAPELPLPSLAATQISTDYAGVKNDLHYFMTAIKDRLVGIRYKAPTEAKTVEDAKAFAIQAGLALKDM